MSQLVRFGVSMEKDLLAQFDDYIERRSYSNRSEAIRDLVRDALIHYKWITSPEEQAGTITLVYDHHSHDVANKLMSIQHDFHGKILSTMHIHLDHHNCLEVIALKGKPAEIQSISNRLIAIKGVKHGSLVITSTGKDLS